MGPACCLTSSEPRPKRLANAVTSTSVMSSDIWGMPTACITWTALPSDVQTGNLQIFVVSSSSIQPTFVIRILTGLLWRLKDSVRLLRIMDIWAPESKNMVASLNTSVLGCALIAPVTTGSNAKLLSRSVETCTKPDASPLYKCRSLWWDFLHVVPSLFFSEHVFLRRQFVDVWPLPRFKHEKHSFWSLTLSPPVVFCSKQPWTPDVFGTVCRNYVHFFNCNFHGEGSIFANKNPVWFYLL